MGSSLGKKNGSERPGKSAPRMKFGLPDFGQVIACVSLHKTSEVGGLASLGWWSISKFPAQGSGSDTQHER